MVNYETLRQHASMASAAAEMHKNKVFGHGKAARAHLDAAQKCDDIHSIKQHLNNVNHHIEMATGAK